MFTALLSVVCGYTMQDDRTLREIASKLKADGMRCNCDLDNWEPEKSTGHSWVCRIHKEAQRVKYRLRDVDTQI